MGTALHFSRNTGAKLVYPLMFSTSESHTGEFPGDLVAGLRRCSAWTCPPHLRHAAASASSLVISQWSRRASLHPFRLSTVEQGLRRHERSVAA